MLTRIALDPNALLEDLDGDCARRRFAHRSLIRLLVEHGVVVLEAGDASFKLLIQQLPQQLRTEWLTAYSHIYHTPAGEPAPISVGNLDNVEELCHQWGGKVSVAVTERLRAESFGVPDDEASCFIADTLEVVRFDLAEHGTTFQRLATLMGSPLPAGARRNDVWRERFHLLCCHTDSLVICDRYAGTELVERGERSGLWWFLRKIDSCGKTKTHLYTSMGRNDRYRTDIGPAVTRLAAELRQGGIRNLQLTIAYDADFQQHVHDRHLRFDHRAFSLGPGMTAFSNEVIPQDYAMHPFDAKTARSREDTLWKLSNPHQQDIPCGAR